MLDGIVSVCEKFALNIADSGLSDNDPIELRSKQNLTPYIVLFYVQCKRSEKKPQFKERNSNIKNLTVNKPPCRNM
jgi:hypothetical protein